MGSEKTYEERIREILVERLFLKIKPEMIAEDEPLMETYGVDSVGLLEMVVGLEDVFGVTFEEDEQFDIEQFRTVRSIADYVRAKLGKSSPDS